MNLTPEQRIKRCVEIGMVYLSVGDEANKQYAIECMLALLTGADSVPAFRAKFRLSSEQWKVGVPYQTRAPSTEP